MLPLWLALGALAVALLLAFLVSLTTPRSRVVAPAGDDPLFGLDGPRLAALLERLLPALGLRIESSRVRGRLVDIYATSDQPLVGGRLFVQGFGGVEPVSDDEVRQAVELTRAEGMGKTVLVSPGEFSPQAQAAVAEGVVELIDGQRLARLARQHLPDAP